MHQHKNCLKKLLPDNLLLLLVVLSFMWVRAVQATDDAKRTWRIEATAICSNGVAPQNKTKLVVGSIPPIPPKWEVSQLKSGSHYKVFTNSDRTRMIVAGLKDEKGKFLEPVYKSLHRVMRGSRYFKDLIWLVQWRHGDLLNGTYKLSFQAPVSWCNTTPTPSTEVKGLSADTPTPTPTCTPRPACLDAYPHRCLPPEPIGGFCPPTSTPTPTDSPKETPTPTDAPKETPTLTPTITLSPTPACPRKSEGDADCNNSIDLVDFEIWRQEFTGITRASALAADFNKDMKADLLDFEIWRGSFTKQGSPTATPIASSTPTNTPAPAITSAPTPTPVIGIEPLPTSDPCYCPPGRVCPDVACPL